MKLILALGIALILLGIIGLWLFKKDSHFQSMLGFGELQKKEAQLFRDAASRTNDPGKQALMSMYAIDAEYGDDFDLLRVYAKAAIIIGLIISASYLTFTFFK